VVEVEVVVEDEGTRCGHLRRARGLGPHSGLRARRWRMRAGAEGAHSPPR